jgi:riboflavin synthase
MFTGIIEEIGRVLTTRAQGGGREIRISASRVLDDLKVEDSVSVNGVCLTVTAIESDGFRVQAVPETLEKTLTGQLRNGTAVNLERALTLQTRLGGHLVLGHVDTVARIDSIKKTGLGAELEISLPFQAARLVSRTGSITISGVSLTVADLPKPTVAAQNRHPVRVAVIPFTLEATTLGSLRVGDSVNIECDSIAKMVQRLLDLPAESENKQTSREGAGTLEQLLRSGF